MSWIQIQRPTQLKQELGVGRNPPHPPHHPPEKHCQKLRGMQNNAKRCPDMISYYDWEMINYDGVIFHAALKDYFSEGSINWPELNGMGNNKS